MQWFRFYHDALDDPKVQMLTPELFRHWVNILCVASRETLRGTLPVTLQLAFQLRTDVVTCDAILAELIERGLIDRLDDGRLAPHNWAVRQPDSDNGAERVRRHRETKRTRNVTRNVTGNVSVTPPDTDTDTDTETASTTPRADRAPVAGSPWSVLSAFLEAVGADPGATLAPAWKSKQLATAKRLIEQGYAEDAVRACAGYMRSQDWRTAPFDLLDVEKNIGKWELAGKPEREAPRRSRKPDANQRTRDEYARNQAIAEATLGTGRR